MPGLELQTVFLVEGIPDDRFSVKGELRPVTVYHQTEDALDRGRGRC
ncbi:hypothetical protein [Actinocorallia populi]|nr:hypothetical protein [Actinocorallia populi]